MTDTPILPEAYLSALALPGLAPERQARLLEHIQRSNEQLSSVPPIAPEVAQCAATLLAVDTEERLTAPTALAQAEALAQLPEAGPALMQLYAGLMTLSKLAQAGFGVGVHRGAIRRVLNYLVQVAGGMMKRLEAEQ